MSILNDLPKLKDKTSILVIFDILLLGAPGVMAVFVFDPSLFIALDWIKLLLLGVAFIAPLVFLNTFFVLEILDNELRPTDKDSLFWAFSMSIYMSGLILYLLVGIHYFFGRGVREIASVIIIIEIALLLFFALRDWKRSWKTRK